ncbi:MAG: hypothetical protein IJN64_13335 [Lachnospiraceae bacterium]|nr:hypothetical protein [Lachnospiraceae bacterium]
MHRAELYTEFSENRTCMVNVDKTELLNRLIELHYGAIIEKEHLIYRIYYSNCKEIYSNQGQDEEYHLKIDPAARVRFEGGLDEYEKLLEEISAEHNNRKIYGILRNGNVESDFLVMDVYYEMNKEEYF